MTTPAKKTTARKAPAKKVAAGPTIKVDGKGHQRLDHSTCDHPRTFAGRQACRKANRPANGGDAK